MALSVRRLAAPFGAEILGADLHQPPTGDLIDAVNAAVAEQAVVVLRDQQINDEEQVRFSRAFGSLELPPHMGLSGPLKRRVAPELYDVSNLDANGDFLPVESLRLASNRANEEFHTDSSFNALPTKWSLLSARVLPPFGANTEFVDTRLVYDSLPQQLKEAAQGAVAEHYFWKTRGRAGYTVITEQMRQAMPPAPHPVARADGELLLQQLNDFAAQPRFIYSHEWRSGDFVIWDNRCTIHRATKYDVFKYKRDLRRTTINEYGPEISSTDALGIAPQRT
jgi:alpha-ketoglutarate-dependent 2,4-dichlorophenoxyacetate dioxygenase